jgi:hypothetical protein
MRRRSHHLAAIGLRARTRQPASGNHGHQYLSLALQTPDGAFGTYTVHRPLKAAPHGAICIQIVFSSVYW